MKYKYLEVNFAYLDEKAKAEIHRLNKLVLRLQEESSKSKEHNNTVSAFNQNLIKTVKNLKIELKDINKVNKVLEIELDAANNVISNKTNEIEAKNDEIKKLKKQLEKLT